MSPGQRQLLGVPRGALMNDCRASLCGVEKNGHGWGLGVRRAQCRLGPGYDLVLREEGESGVLGQMDVPEEAEVGVRGE